MADSDDEDDCKQRGRQLPPVKSLKVGPSTDLGADFGPLVTTAHLDNVTSGMRICKEEIFGPVLAVVRAKTYEEALKMTNSQE